MSAFVDTSAFIALLIAEDEHHRTAGKIWQRLVASDEQLVTSNYTLVETCALLHRRSGISTVRTFIEDLLPVVLVQWVDVELHTTGVGGMLTSGNRGPSIVDCVSFALMRKLKLRQVFTFDRHFREQGFDLVR
ncbi:MAG: PIN domain-containing protein [Armatimonadota bacterium]|nr:PIN domain-containing protein [Armatimonadota bacterium]